MHLRAPTLYRQIENKMKFSVKSSTRVNFVLILYLKNGYILELPCLVNGMKYLINTRNILH